MIPNNSSQQSAVQEAGERPEVTEETHLLQTSLSELDITISRRDTTEPYIIAAMRELKWIATSSPWAVITRVLQASFYFVNVIAVSHLGTKNLAAMSLAVTLQTILAMAPISGYVSAMDTFCSTAYTASRDKTLVGFHLQRGIIAICAHLIVITPILWNAESILLFIGQDPDIAHLSGLFLRISIFGMLPLALYEATKRYLQAQGLMHAGTIVVCIVAPIQWISNIVLVRSERFGLGFIGAPIVDVIANWALLIGILLFERNSRVVGSWGGWNIKAFQNMWGYYKYAIPAVLILCSTWVCFELLAIGSSYFGADQLAGNAIMINTISILYYFSSGIGQTTGPRIGNLMGQAKPRQARIATSVSLLMTTCNGIVGVLVLSLCSSWWLPVYTNDPNVIREALRIIPFACLATISFAINGSLNGISRGLGQQKISAKMLIFGFYVCGMPLALYVGYVRHMETPGLWLGASTGFAIATTLLLLYMILVIDWKDEVRLCILRLKAKKAATARNAEAE